MKKLKTPIYKAGSYRTENGNILENGLRYMPFPIKAVIFLILVSLIPISFLFFKEKTAFMFFLAVFIPLLWVYHFTSRLIDGKELLKKSRWYFRILRCIIYVCAGVFAFWQTEKIDTVSIGYRVLYIEWPVLYAMFAMTILRNDNEE